MLIQPADRGKMGFIKVFGDPHDDLCFETGKVSEYLPEVLKVGVLQLILDEHASVILRNTRNDVSPVRAYRYLCAFKFKIRDAQLRGQPV